MAGSDFLKMFANQCYFQDTLGRCDHNALSFIKNKLQRNGVMLCERKNHNLAPRRVDSLHKWSINKEKKKFECSEWPLPWIGLSAAAEAQCDFTMFRRAHRCTEEHSPTTRVVEPRGGATAAKAQVGTTQVPHLLLG